MSADRPGTSPESGQSVRRSLEPHLAEQVRSTAPAEMPPPPVPEKPHPEPKKPTPAQRLRAAMQAKDEASSSTLRDALLSLGPPGILTREELVAELLNIHEQMHDAPQDHPKAPANLPTPEVKAAPNPPQVNTVAPGQAESENKPVLRPEGTMTAPAAENTATAPPQHTLALAEAPLAENTASATPSPPPAAATPLVENNASAEPSPPPATAAVPTEPSPPTAAEPTASKAPAPTVEQQMAEPTTAEQTTAVALASAVPPNTDGASNGLTVEEVRRGPVVRFESTSYLLGV